MTHFSLRILAPTGFSTPYQLISTSKYTLRNNEIPFHAHLGIKNGQNLMIPSVGKNATKIRTLICPWGVGIFWWIKI